LTRPMRQRLEGSLRLAEVAHRRVDPAQVVDLAVTHRDDRGAAGVGKPYPARQRGMFGIGRQGRLDAHRSAHQRGERRGNVWGGHLNRLLGHLTCLVTLDRVPTRRATSNGPVGAGRSGSSLALHYLLTCASSRNPPGARMSVRIEKLGSVWTVVLSRPEARNAMDGASADALVAAFTRFEADA